MQCICTWILSFSYEFLYNEFASQFLQQNMCMHKLKMCIVWSGFHLSTQEMVCTKNLFFSNYFWEVQKSTYCESFILGTRDGRWSALKLYVFS
jgi:hypothetical protein